MANWIACSDSAGHRIYVNLDNAISMTSDQAGRTKIAFMGAEKEHIVVVEPLEQLVQFARKAN